MCFPLKWDRNHPPLFPQTARERPNRQTSIWAEKHLTEITDTSFLHWPSFVFALCMSDDFENICLTMRLFDLDGVHVVEILILSGGTNFMGFWCPTCPVNKLFILCLHNFVASCLLTLRCGTAAAAHQPCCKRLPINTAILQMDSSYVPSKGTFQMLTWGTSNPTPAKSTRKATTYLLYFRPLSSCRYSDVWGYYSNQKMKADAHTL